MQSKNRTQPIAAQLKKVRIMYWWALASAAFTVDSSNFSEKANIILCLKASIWTLEKKPCLWFWVDTTVVLGFSMSTMETSCHAYNTHGSLWIQLQFKLLYYCVYLCQLQQELLQEDLTLYHPRPSLWWQTGFQDLQREQVQLLGHFSTISQHTVHGQFEFHYDNSTNVRLLYFQIPFLLQ